MPTKAVLGFGACSWQQNTLVQIKTQPKIFELASKQFCLVEILQEYRERINWKNHSTGHGLKRGLSFEN